MNEANLLVERARLGLDPEQNLRRAIILYRQALDSFPPGSLDAGICQTNAASAHVELAALGFDSEENFRQAIMLCKQAARCFTSGSQGAGRCELQEASAHLGLSALGIDSEQNLDQAGKLYRRAIRTFPLNSADAGNCQLNAAGVYLELARCGIAGEQNLRQAIMLSWDALGCFPPNSQEAGVCLMNQANLHSELARLGVDAEQNLRQAILFCRQAFGSLGTNPRAAGRCKMNEARAHMELSGLGIDSENNLNQAILLYAEAQGFFIPQASDATGCQTDAATAHLEIAKLGVDPQQNLKRAIQLYREAIGSFATNSPDAGRCRMNVANAYSELASLGIDFYQNLRQAIQFYEEAIDSLVPNSPDAGACLMNAANAYSQLARNGVDPEHNLSQAMALYREALTCFASGSPAAGSCQLNVAGAHIALADLGVHPEKNLYQAMEFYHQALICFAPGSTAAGVCLLGHANVHYELAGLGINRPESLRICEVLANDAKACLDSRSLDRAKACYALALTLEQQYRHEEAHSEALEAIKILEFLGHTFRDEVSRREFREAFRRIYRFMVSLCLDISATQLQMAERKAGQSEPFLREALNWVCLSKARTLQESLASWRARHNPILAADLDDLLRRFSRLERTVKTQRNLAQASAGEQIPNDGSIFRSRIRALLAQTDLRDPPQTTSTDGLPLDQIVAAIAQLSPSHRAVVVLEFFQATEERLGVFVHPATGTCCLKEPIWLPGGVGRATDLAQQSSSACKVLAREGRARTGAARETPPSPEACKEARATLESVGRELGEMLMGLKEAIDNQWQDATLILCPTGPLHFLPLAAAHWGDTVTLSPKEEETKTKTIPRTLIDAHSIVYLPTVALAAEVAQQERPLTRTAYVAAADPFGSLSEIWVEAASVRQALENKGFAVSCVEREQAIARSLWEHGPDAWIIHLAMHTGIDKDFEFCGAEFDDRRLLVLELLSWLQFRRAALAVVATCSSSYPFDLTADDPSALTRAWMLAGATSVIGSLWPLVDERAKEFSQEFYRQWVSEGKPLADAVRVAMLHVRERAAGDIYDWAPFVLVGSGATQVM